MASNRAIGTEYELKAAHFLEKEGYRLLDKNYRSGRCEIDLVLKSPEELLVFVEVKYRSGRSFGEPEEFLSKEQFDRIQLAAENYLHETDWKGQIRFDVIAICGDELRHIVDYTA